MKKEDGVSAGSATIPPTNGPTTATWVELYKHHFDLFLKGYAVQLAIVGAVAGFVFRPGLDTTTRSYLLAFVMLVTAISGAAWLYGLAWRRRVVRHLAKQLGAETAEDLVYTARGVLALGVAGSLVIFLGALAAFLGLF